MCECVYMCVCVCMCMYVYICVKCKVNLNNFKDFKYLMWKKFLTVIHNKINRIK